ncbi:MAG: hypothetical protein AAGA20_04335 [Planctomycetota bacterium]
MNASVAANTDPIVFNNSAPTGHFYDVSDGSVVFDEGRMPSTTAPEAGVLDSYSVSEFEIAYVTRALDVAAGGPGARVVVTFYPEADPCDPPTRLPMPIGRFDLTGLPASPVAGAATTHVVSVAPQGTLCFRADGDGRFDASAENRFVWSLGMPEETNGPAGPLVAGDPLACAFGDGTYFGATTACGTGLDAADSFAQLHPDGTYGCTDLGGYPQNPFSSFHLVVRAPLAGDCVGCGIGDPFLEQNDDCASAITLFASRALGLLAESGDDDYYRFVLRPGEVATAVCRFDPQIADLDLELYDASCSTLLATGEESDDGETIEYLLCGSAPVDLVLRVPALAGGCANYDLVVERAPFEDDAFEDNDACGQPALGGVTTFTTGALVVSECDPDVFSLRLDDLREVQVDVLFDADEANVQVRLIDPNCQTVLATGAPTPDGVAVRYFNVSGTTTMVLAEVTASGGKGFADYSLSACYSVGDVVGFQACAGVPNSTGVPATMCARGSEVASDGFLLFYAVDLPPLAFGYFITSLDTEFRANPGGATGNLCLAATGIGRYSYDVLQTSQNNAVFYRPDLDQTPSPTTFLSVMAGERRYWQFWYRDTDGAGGTTSNFASAVGVTFQ